MTSRRNLLMGLGLAAPAVLGGNAAAGPRCGGRSTLGVDAATPGSPVTIPDTDCFDMRAASSGALYRIKTAWPSAPPQEGALHPLIILLDGDDYFEMFVEMARILAYAGEAPQAVIAGIGYPAEDRNAFVKARLRDFTWVPDKPHEALVAKIAGGAEGIKSGGGARFLDFIDKQLKPELARRHGASLDEASLFAHSLGGLFALNTLFADSGSFRSYAISSPPLLWADNHILNEEKKYAKAHADLHARVILAIGGEETSLSHVLGLPEEFKAIETDFVEAMGAPDPLAQLSSFYETLAGRAYPGLDLEFQVLEGESHTSVAPAAFLRALRRLSAAPSAPGR